jgi:DNA-binding SARP family transcriptional activator
MPFSPTPPVDAHPAHLELPGSMRIVAGDGRWLPLGPRAALLVVLVAIGAAHERAQLARLLYPDLETAAARRNLRQLLHKQRLVLDAVIEHQGTRLRARAGVRLTVASAEYGPDRRDAAQHALAALAGFLADDRRASG